MKCTSCKKDISDNTFLIVEKPSGERLWFCRTECLYRWVCAFFNDMNG